MSSAKRLRVGIIGAGGVSQHIHLPTLKDLSDLYEVVSVADVSAQAREYLGEKFNIPKRFADYRELLAERPEVVLIAAPHALHAEIAIAACQAGVPALLEKPMCLNVAEGRELVAASERTGTLVQVGYMHRYDAAFRWAESRIRGMKDLRLARANVIIGPNDAYVRDSIPTKHFGDVPAALGQELGERMRAGVQQVVGTDADPVVEGGYRLLLGLTTHVMPLLRVCLGKPVGVIASEFWSNGRFHLAVFDYGQELRAEMTSGGGPRYKSTEWNFSVMGLDEEVRVEFSSGFLKNAPSRVIVQGDAEGRFESKLELQGHASPYREEWGHMHDCLMNGTAPLSPVQECLADIELMEELARKAGQG